MGMKVIGLTGGIASGKSTVADMIRAGNHPVLDADQTAREVVAAGSEGLAAIVDAFGDEILTAEGALDRKAMGQRIFSSADARARLNGIVHPRVQALMDQQVMQHARAGIPMLFMDIPLLYEARDPADFEAIVVVYVDPTTQRMRLMARNGLSNAEAQARIDSQLSLDEKRVRADFVIDNRGDLEGTRAQAMRLLWHFRGDAFSSDRCQDLSQGQQKMPRDGRK